MSATPGKQKLIGIALGYSLIVAVLFHVHSRYFENTQPLPAYGSTPELFLELSAAMKFAQCGFLRTLLLPDYGSSTDCADAPFVYTHMPSGPSVFLGTLVLAGFSLSSTRLIFALISLVGVLCLYLVCVRIYQSLPIATLTVLFAILSFDGFLVWSDHFVHAFFWLSYFGAIYLFQSRESSVWKDRLYLARYCLALATNFICAFALWISFILLYFSDRTLSKRRKFRNATVVALVFLLAHLIRNGVYLGPEVAAAEILYTLTNRIMAIPPRSELLEFFQTHGIVLWGADRLEGKLVSNWALDFLAAYLAPILLVITSTLARFVFHKRDFLRLSQVISIIFGLFAWYIIFLAHGQYYTLPYVTRTSGAMLVGLAFAEVVFWARHIKAVWRSSKASADQISLWRTYAGLRLPQKAMLCSVFVFFIWLPFPSGHGFLVKPLLFALEPTKEIDNPVFRSIFDGLLLLQKIPSSSSVWTNIDAPVLKYFTKASVVGSCSEEAFRQLDLSKCFGLFMHPESASIQTAKSPDYFLLSAAFEPGSMICREECTARLAWSLGDANQMVAEGPVWWLIKVRKSNP